MKKSIITIMSFILLAAFAAGFLSACNFLNTGAGHEPLDPPSPDDHPLVGAWVWDRPNSNYLYVFHADGRGSRGAFRISTFTWSVSQRGYLRFDFGNRTEAWDFTIDDDMLTIDSRTSPQRYSYIRKD